MAPNSFNRAQASYVSLAVEETGHEPFSPTRQERIIPMSNAVAKVIELTASSPKSIEDAVENGIRRADTTLDNVEGAWVQDIKCVVKNGKIAEWRVNMKVTFLLKE
jgi:flavin-binding protein dodecin